MTDFSVVIAGKAGEGINQAGALIGEIFSSLGYKIYVYSDYPSLIRGGQNAAIIRAGKEKILAHTEKIDFVIALDQNAVNAYSGRLADKKNLVYDSSAVKSGGFGINLADIIKEEGAQPIMKNTCIIGAFCKCAGIAWPILENIITKKIKRETALNLKVAKRGYESTSELFKINKISDDILEILSGNESCGLGLVNRGLKSYLGYPMTPASGILHFLAENSAKYGLKVIHPESELSVMLMACGLIYSGEKTAVGTSGGGFCLMVEGLSMTGMAEIPIVVVMSQRPGPSTGVPTYTAQADLNFVLSAGHGEFLRFVIAPGDAEEAFSFSQIAMDLAWKYQIPAIILMDKTLSEGIYSFEPKLLEDFKIGDAALWDEKDGYKRYAYTQTGVSPMAFPGQRNAVIKVNSYEHDDYGITVEEADKIKGMQEKRFKKQDFIKEDVKKLNPVRIYGDKSSSTAVICWGSNKGVAVETAKNLGLKVIQPIILSPFPGEELKDALKGSKKVYCVENNITGQLAGLARSCGVKIDSLILKYDGRPFTVEELTERLK